MVKTITSVYLDLEPLLDCRQRGLNISAICNRAIIDACGINPLNTKIEILRAEAQNIENKQKEIIDKRNLAQAEKLGEFLTKVSVDILNNEVGLAYWSKETGKTADELRLLKLGKAKGDE